MAKTGVGIIGCGARIRQVVGPLIDRGDAVEIVALCDPSDASIERFCGPLSISPRRYPDNRRLCADPAVQWVFIGSWNACHRSDIETALRAGKDVFCEKPLATNLEDCLTIYKTWAQSGRRFSIGFTLRYSPHYQQIKNLIDSGILGRIISIEFNETLDFNHGGYIMGGWRSLTQNAGSHLLEKCCHDIDMANWLLSSRARRVAGFGGLDVFLPAYADRVEALGSSAEGKKAFFAWGQPHNPFLNDKDIIDNQVAIIEFESGTRATFHTNCCSGIPERRMYILGEHAAIRADAIEGKIEVRKVGFDEPIRDVSTPAKGSHAGGDEVLCQSLLETMRHGRQPRTGMSDALMSAATCFAIDEATATGSVVNCEAMWKKVDAVVSEYTASD